jgi:signal transduction histidine kinase
MTNAPSLTWRLAAAACIWITVALFVAGFALSAIFAQHARSVLKERLVDDLEHIASAIEIAGDGSAYLSRPLPDSQYDAPYSGRYWQVEIAGQSPLRSRSLWDYTLPNPPDDLKPGEIHHHEFSGPDGQALIVAERSLGLDGFSQPIRLVVASSEADLESSIASFRATLFGSLLILGAGLAIAVAFQIHFGLAPLRKLRRAVLALKLGEELDSGGAWPGEVAPLVDDLRDVLARNRALVERARAEAGNLAHGLKTPIAILVNAARAEKTPLAHTVTTQSSIMMAHIERHLTRARAGAAAIQVGVSTDARANTLKLIDTLGRLHPERKLRLSVSGSGVRFAGRADDFSNIAGNLIDNALKWSRSEVLVTLASLGNKIELVVDDDGPGIPIAERATALKRGVRLDETVPGSGFGLAIADELVSSYGGSLMLESSSRGGLRVVVRLPAAR